jgi:dienelactone hydrolase
MRAFFVAAALLFCTTFSFGQGIVALLTRSEDFIDLLNQDKYEEAYVFFDESVKDKVSSNTLLSLWTAIEGQSGQFVKIESESSGREGEFIVVIVKCKFQNGEESFRLVYNSSEKLVGLFMLPKNNADTYAAPSYADTSRYTERQVSVNTPGHTLAGMVTVPKNATNFPLVVLVHGSGPSDMDETVGPNKPFRDLAAGLAGRGIATLRYVKRTLVYPKEFSGAITVKEETLDDAVQAVAVARTIPGVNKNQIYVLGHSLGGMLAPRIAAVVPDLAGIILAAAPARKLTDLLVEQNTNLFSHSGDTTLEGRKRLDEALKMLQATRMTQLGGMKPDSIVLFAPATYWVDINNYDQVAAAKKLKTRIFVVQGENDIQVSTEDFRLWKQALEGNANVSFKLYSDLDHKLSPQSAKDWVNSISRQTNVASYLIGDIADWILQKP